MVTKTNNHNHPIPAKHVAKHGEVTSKEIHAHLEEVAEHATEELIKEIDGATPHENLYENDHAAAAFTEAMWEVIFDGIGLTFDSNEYSNEYVDDAQYAVRTAHERFGVNELGMEHDQLAWPLVASKDE